MASQADGPEPARGSGPDAHDSSGDNGSPAVDVEALAERVYQLMRAEIRLDTIRSGGRRHPES